MAGPSWLVDGNRFAMKIKSACDPDRVTWRSNPTKACPNCHYVIDNSDVAHDWPGLPKGVKFDPTDQEILWHLLAKVGVGDLKPHPFINEFIPTVESDDGICYTHPKNLPGVKQDGTVSHFFHRAIKAYNTGTRKRRKIQGDDSGDVRWHKTGKTKPVALDDQKGCKKIMVLYMSQTKGAKPDKTNWVMHQYHLGTGEDESEGEYVISKIFYQQQPGSKGDKNENNGSENNNPMIAKVDPVTPQSVTPDPSCGEGQCLELNPPKESNVANTFPDLYAQTETQADQSNTENQADDGHDSQDEEENKWWESESQHLLDSQQLVEGLSLCDELLQSQSPARDGNGNVNERADGKPRLSDYAKLGPEDLKKDLEECQNLVLDPAAIEIDTPPEFRLSQLDFGSQDSVFAWSGNVAD